MYGNRLRDRRQRSEVKGKKNEDRRQGGLRSSPVEIWLRRKVKRRKRRVGEGGRYGEGFGTKRGGQTFEKKLGKVEIGELEKEWRRMEGRIREAIRKMEEGIEKRGGERRGLNEGCEIRKKEVRRELRKWKKEGKNGNEYRKKKLEYKEMCE